MLDKFFVKASKAICKGIQKDDTYRKSLHRVRIDETGWAVATDGKVLIADRTMDPEGWVNPAHLRAQDATVSRNGEGCYVDQKGVTTHHPDDYEGGPQTFPKWKGVMPPMFEHHDGVEGYTKLGLFDPRVLEKALAAFDGQPDDTVEVWLKTDENRDRVAAVYLRSEKRPHDRVALVMPCRALKK